LASVKSDNEKLVRKLLKTTFVVFLAFVLTALGIKWAANNVNITNFMNFLILIPFVSSLIIITYDVRKRLYAKPTGNELKQVYIIVSIFMIVIVSVSCCSIIISPSTVSLLPSPTPSTSPISPSPNPASSLQPKATVSITDVRCPINYKTTIKSLWKGYFDTITSAGLTTLPGSLFTIQVKFTSNAWFVEHSIDNISVSPNVFSIVSISPSLPTEKIPTGSSVEVTITIRAPDSAYSGPLTINADAS
jgi:hypothetical protein